MFYEETVTCFHLIWYGQHREGKNIRKYTETQTVRWSHKLPSTLVWNGFPPLSQKTTLFVTMKSHKTLLFTSMQLDLPTNKHVSRKGPKWFTCMPIWRLSSVRFFPRPVAPALLIRMSTLFSVSIMLLANLRIDAKEAKSRWCTSIFLFSVLLIISSANKQESSTHVQHSLY